MTQDGRTWIYRDRTEAHLTHSVRGVPPGEVGRAEMQCGKRVLWSSCTLGFIDSEITCPDCLAVMALEAEGWRLLP